MDAKNSSTAKVSSPPTPDAASTRHLTITRIIDAPRALVFKAWTDPRHLAQWFTLDTLKTIHSEIDVRAGGKWVMKLLAPDGVEITARRVYREIVEPERIVFYEKCDAGGNVILDGTHTVTFEEHAGKTTITVKCDLVTPFDAGNQQGWSGGWNEILDKLAAHVANR